MDPSDVPNTWTRSHLTDLLLFTHAKPKPQEDAMTYRISAHQAARHVNRPGVSKNGDSPKPETPRTETPQTKPKLDDGQN